MLTLQPTIITSTATAVGRHSPKSLQTYLGGRLTAVVIRGVVFDYVYMYSVGMLMLPAIGKEEPVVLITVEWII